MAAENCAFIYVSTIFHRLSPRDTGKPAGTREMVKISLFKKEAKSDRSQLAGDERSSPRLASEGAGGEAAQPYPHRLTNDTLLLLQNFEQSSQGWFWATDSEGRLTYLT